MSNDNIKRLVEFIESATEHEDDIPHALLAIQTGDDFILIGGFDNPYNALPLFALGGRVTTSYLVMSGRARQMSAPNTVDELVNYTEPEPVECRIVVSLRNRDYSVAIAIGDEEFDDQTEVDALNSGFVDALNEALDLLEEVV